MSRPEAPIGLQGNLWGFERGKAPATAAVDYWVNLRCRQAWKNALRVVLTAPNPYNGGKDIKDDPTVIGIELANETGLNERRFDYNMIYFAMN